ncbi:hypothetical protein BC939DRAFT_460873 [Gamsiella multidivaricata]|uniref:uncharacterized protein n=1 Tax=Gamsiella multidivaricata TaxID=101098 RepID=UPI00221F7580|nr:uncharacterized protein BC939DRAFT_460873 [Gamsiella multidivaricata]KAI7819143.1 hypothetical protein BC939DRAFT_460873 [Gamsiella multidivaricata]
MKFSTCALLISAAIATVASAAPMAARVPTHTGTRTKANIGSSSVIAKRHCGECSHKDQEALDLIIDVSAKHYANIAQTRLDDLVRDLTTSRVTSSTKGLGKKKSVLDTTIQSNIEKAKEDCSSEALARVIKTTVTSDADMDIPWSKEEEVEKIMMELDSKITQVMLEHIQTNINAEDLSKDCTEKMTNTEIAPAPAKEEFSVDSSPSMSEAPAAEAPAPEVSTSNTRAPEAEASASMPEAPAAEPEAPASMPEVPAAEPEAPASIPATTAPMPETSAPAPQETTESTDGKNEPKVSINNASTIDPKFVCKSGCKDLDDAKAVLDLRKNLEEEFAPVLDNFYKYKVLTDCSRRRGEFFIGIRALHRH